MSGSREIRVSEKSIFHSIAIFSTYYACAAFNWVLFSGSYFGNKQKLRVAGFFASFSDLFLHTLGCNKRVKPSIHCIHL